MWLQVAAEAAPAGVAQVCVRRAAFAVFCALPAFFAAVVETAAMNTEEVAAYCRQRGIYSDQLKRWRHDCEQAASLSYEEQRQEADLSKQQRKRIQELERELRRKNDALAEAAALLTLSKKVRAIWGDAES